MCANTPIVNRLYEKYYILKETPKNVVSSHWKHYHEMAHVKFRGSEMTIASGVGFGDVAHKSFISRIFDSLTIASYLCFLKERRDILRLMKIARSVANKMGISFSYDCFRQVCSLNLIMKRLKRLPGHRLWVICIGDGYGFLSGLLKECFPDSLICLVDLGKTLLFQSYHLGMAFPHYKHEAILDANQEERVVSLNADFLYCPAEYLEQLSVFSFDLGINIASMQEMNSNSIESYFQFLRQHMNPENLFYCCNRVSKIMPAGETSNFFMYPWVAEDRHFIDELCPWHKYFLSYRHSNKGPLFLNLRIPFVNYFDGQHHHRLSILHCVAERHNKGRTHQFNKSNSN